MIKKETVEKIRQKIDGDISTDIIVGFPGETEEDFNQTLELVKTVKFSQLFGYMYSRRSGTVADKMTNQIPLEIKNNRVNILLNLQKSMLKNAEEYIGKKMVGFATEYNAGTLLELDNSKTVLVEKELPLYEFYDVEITDFIAGQLIAKII